MRINVNNLMRLVKTLRSAPREKAKHFSMGTFIYSEGDDLVEQNPNMCGTPACALGWYASNGEQRAFKIGKIPGRSYHQTALLSKVGKDFVPYAEFSSAEKHFGLDGDEEIEELFGHAGCGGAKTTKQAANYIERFIVRKLREELRSGQ